jgi:hypothetical protein
MIHSLRDSSHPYCTMSVTDTPLGWLILEGVPMIVIEYGTGVPEVLTVVLPPLRPPPHEDSESNKAIRNREAMREPLRHLALVPQIRIVGRPSHNA